MFLPVRSLIVNTIARLDAKERVAISSLPRLERSERFRRIFKDHLPRYLKLLSFLGPTEPHSCRKSLKMLRIPGTSREFRGCLVLCEYRGLLGEVLAEPGMFPVGRHDGSPSIRTKR